MKSFSKPGMVIVYLTIFLFSGCSSKNTKPTAHDIETDTKYVIHDVPPESLYEPELKSEPEIAHISTSTPNFKVNNNSLPISVITSIKTGLNSIRYDGFVEITIASKPLIELEKNQENAAKFTACISALPLCPVTLLLMYAVFNEENIKNTKCIGELEFHAYNNNSYFVMLEKSEKIEPKIVIVSEFNNITVSEKALKCDMTKTNQK